VQKQLIVETPLLEIQTPLILANYIIKVIDLVLPKFHYYCRLVGTNSMFYV
jgi:hypothetical protein